VLYCYGFLQLRRHNSAVPKAVDDVIISVGSLDVSLQTWNDEAVGLGLGNGQLSSFEMVQFVDNQVTKHDVFIGNGEELDLQILNVSFQPMDAATPFLFPWSGMVGGEVASGSLIIFSEIPPEVADEFTEDPTLGTATPQTMTMRWRWSTVEGSVNEVTLTTTLQNVAALMEHPALPFANGLAVDGDISSVPEEEAYLLAGPGAPNAWGFVCGCNNLNTLCPNAWCKARTRCPTAQRPEPPSTENCHWIWTWVGTTIGPASP
jgi:hypothetical protein